MCAFLCTRVMCVLLRVRFYVCVSVCASLCAFVCVCQFISITEESEVSALQFIHPPPSLTKCLHEIYAPIPYAFQDDQATYT